MAISALERLNPRERRLVTIFGMFLGGALVLAVPIGLESLVRSREADNQELYAALTAVQEARGIVRERQEKKEMLLARYSKRAPALAGFLEQAAQHEKLELMDSDNRPDVPHGKRYVERSTTTHLKKAGLVPIARFLEALEKSGYPIEVSHLSFRKRLGEPDSYDIQVGVSAYDRADVPPAPTPAAALPSASAAPLVAPPVLAPPPVLTSTPPPAPAPPPAAPRAPSPPAAAPDATPATSPSPPPTAAPERDQ